MKMILNLQHKELEIKPLSPLQNHHLHQNLLLHHHLGKKFK